MRRHRAPTSRLGRHGAALGFPPPPRLLFTSSSLSRFRPQGAPHHTELAPADSCRILQYCVSLFTDIQHISQKRKKVATVIYSILSVGGCQKIRSQSRLTLFVYPVPESRRCQSLVVYAVGSANKGRVTEASVALPICTSIRTLTRALGPPLRPAQQRSGPDSQPQDQHPR